MASLLIRNVGSHLEKISALKSIFESQSTCDQLVEGRLKAGTRDQ